MGARRRVRVNLQTSFLTAQPSAPLILSHHTHRNQLGEAMETIWKSDFAPRTWACLKVFSRSFKFLLWWPLIFFWWRAVQTFITFGSTNPHQRKYCRVVINTLASIRVSLPTWVSYRTVPRCRHVSNSSPWDAHGPHTVSTHPINLTRCVWKVYRSIQNTYSLCFFLWFPSVEKCYYRLMVLITRNKYHFGSTDHPISPTQREEEWVRPLSFFSSNASMP